MTQVWSLQRLWYRAMVMSSARPFICMAPSPTRAITGRSGWANFAPMAYGTPGPMVARGPDSDARMAPRMRRLRAYQLVEDPESAVTMALSGIRFDSSDTIAIGFTGS